MTTIPGATVKTMSDGVHVNLKFKTPKATFTLRPVRGQREAYLVQITPKTLPGIFSNSGLSSFGMFLVERYPGRNAVSRPEDCKPLAGNAVLMWPAIPDSEKTRVFDYLEKLIRGEIPKIEVAKAA